MERERSRSIIRKLLRPIVRLGLRRSLSIHDFVAALKLALMDIAEEDLIAAGEEVNVSRLSVITGMYRAELKSLYVDKRPPKQEPQSILSRAIVQWEQDSRFRTASGAPRVLNQREFHELVECISKAIHPTTVLFEMERNGVIERSPRGFRLIHATEYVDRDEERVFELVGQDIQTYISAAMANMKIISPEDDPGHLHHRTEFDNVFVDSIPQVREWILAEGRAFHRRLREFLGRHDRDLSDAPSAGKKAGTKVVVSLASFVEPAVEREQKTKQEVA